MKIKAPQSPLTSRALSAFLMLTAAVAFCILPAVARGSQLVLNFAANTGSSIQFNAGTESDAPTFQINPGLNGYQFNVTSEEGGSSAVGLNGSILNGPFNYGPVSPPGPGGIETATVNGPLGTLEISDGTQVLTGTVNFIQILTYPFGVGALNAQLNVNVTDLTYSGSNPDLQLLVLNQPGTMDVSFQFASPESLSQLAAGPGSTETSYSASLSVDVTVVPEPSAGTMLVISAGLLVVFRRRDKSKRKGSRDNAISSDAQTLT